MANDISEKTAQCCPRCGTSVSPGQKFCQKCGCKLSKGQETVVETQPKGNADPPPAENHRDQTTKEKEKPSVKETAKSAAGKAIPAVSQAATGALSNLAPQMASAIPGEVAIGEFGGASASEILGPLGTIVSSAKGAVTSIVGIIKNKQWIKLIIAGVLAVVWIVLMILSYNGINIGILNWLTFARGGMGRSIFGWVGGFLGKFTVATAVFSLIGGGYKSIGSGCKALFRRDNFQLQNLAWVLSGAGAALVIYQFFAGNAYWTDTMSAISGGVLAIMALGSSGGLLFRLAQSLTAKVSGKVRVPQAEKATALLSGVTYGFTFGVVLSFIPFGWLPIIFGVVCIVAGVVLMIVFKNKKEGVSS